MKKFFSYCLIWFLVIGCGHEVSKSEIKSCNDSDHELRQMVFKHCEKDLDASKVRLEKLYKIYQAGWDDIKHEFRNLTEHQVRSGKIKLNEALNMINEGFTLYEDFCSKVMIIDYQYINSFNESVQRASHATHCGLEYIKLLESKQKYSRMHYDHRNDEFASGGFKEPLYSAGKNTVSYTQEFVESEHCPKFLPDFDSVKKYHLKEISRIEQEVEEVLYGF